MPYHVHLGGARWGRPYPRTEDRYSDMHGPVHRSHQKGKGARDGSPTRENESKPRITGMFGSSGRVPGSTHCWRLCRQLEGTSEGPCKEAVLPMRIWREQE